MANGRIMRLGAVATIIAVLFIGVFGAQAQDGGFFFEGFFTATPTATATSTTSLTPTPTTTGTGGATPTATDTATTTPTPTFTATYTSTPSQIPTPTATATNACTRHPYTTQGNSLSSQVGTAGYLGTINACIIPDATPVPGQPPWAPILLPTDGSTGALIDFTIYADNSTPDPTDYTLLVNGHCLPVTQGGSSGCQKPPRGTHYYCTQPGKFNFSWKANNFVSVPEAILCVPPSEMPQ